MLKSGLDSEFGLIPLEHEMSTAANLMQRGFDVDFVDIEGRGRSDYIAERDGASLEVECKNFSADLGRQIQRRKVYLLAQQLKDPVERALDANPGGHFIRIVVPTKLYGSRDFLANIAALAADALSNQRSCSGDDIEIEYGAFDFGSSAFARAAPAQLSPEEARDSISDLFALENQTCLFNIRPRSGAVAVAIESRRPDSVLAHKS
jgi:hypothetical protein